MAKPKPVKRKKSKKKIVPPKPDTRNEHEKDLDKEFERQKGG